MIVYGGKVWSMITRNPALASPYDDERFLNFLGYDFLICQLLLLGWILNYGLF